MSVYKFLTEQGEAFPSYDKYQNKFYFKDAGDGEFILTIPEDTIVLGVNVGNDDDYLFINNNTSWYNNGFKPEEFEQNKDRDSLISFNELGPWAKWLILSWK